MFFQGHSIGHISGMVGPIDVKRKGGTLVGYWVNYVTLTFHLTYDLDLIVSRSKFEIALFEEWGADWHGMKGMWVDHSWPWLWPMGNHGGVGGCVPYSDWGDFRRRRAVDISSYACSNKFTIYKGLTNTKPTPHPHPDIIYIFSDCAWKTS